MKRFFYGVMVASLAIGGCSKKEEKAIEPKREELMLSDEDREAEEALNALTELLSQTNDVAEVALAEEALANEFDELERMNGDTTLAWAEDFALENEAIFKPVQFASNDSSINGQEEAMEENISIARQAIEDGENIIVAGYTDQLGMTEANEILSLERAEAVKAHLVAHGIPAERITTVAHGETAPLAWTNAVTEADRSNALAINRRAELYVA